MAVGNPSIGSVAETAFSQTPTTPPTDSRLNVVTFAQTPLADRIDVSHDPGVGWTVTLVVDSPSGLIGPRGSIADTLRAVAVPSAAGEGVRFNISRRRLATGPVATFGIQLPLAPTPRLLEAMSLASTAAGAGRVGTRHLLVGVLDQPDNIAHQLLAAAVVDEGPLRSSLCNVTYESEQSDRHQLTAPARAVIERMALSAASLGHTYLGCEHLLLAITEEPSATARTILAAHGANHQDIRHEAERLMSGPRP
jgi:hypothetical protein